VRDALLTQTDRLRELCGCRLVDGHIWGVDVVSHRGEYSRTSMPVCVCGPLPQCFAVQLSVWELRVSDIGRGSTEAYDLDRGVLRHGGVVGAEVRQIALQACGPGELEVAGGQRVQTFAGHRGDVDGNGAVLGALEVGQG